MTKNKILNQLEPEIREFNCKFLNKILATNKNLYTWKIFDSYNCIYCLPHAIEHTDRHLFWDCPHIQEIWDIFSRVFDTDINWSIIVKDVKGNHYINQLLSLLMYVIYKKFQNEKNLNGPIEETRAFVRRELIFRKEHYEVCDKISGILGNIENFLQELEH